MSKRRFSSHYQLMISIAALGLLTACATNFTGAAHFPGGVSGCSSRCSEQGLEAAAFVYAGDYSTACVCQAKTGTAAQLASSDVSLDSASASDASASGVSASAAEDVNSGEVSDATVEPNAPSPAAPSTAVPSPTPAPATGAAPLRGGPVNSGATPVAPRSGSGRRGQ